MRLCKFNKKYCKYIFVYVFYFCKHMRASHYQLNIYLLLMQKRILSVTKSRRNKRYVSSIRLSGLWLSDYGFCSKTKIDVSIKNGEIIIKKI